MFRLGAAGYGVRAAATDAGSEAQLQAVVAPITAGILLRADRRGTGLWGGIGGTIAIQRLRVVLDEQTVADGWRMGVGPTVMGGVSRRLSPGEVVLTATGSWIGGGRGELAVTGNLGGLAVGLGYRLLY
jgi:hypothetical protein